MSTDGKGEVELGSNKPISNYVSVPANNNLKSRLVSWAVQENTASVLHRQH